MTTTAEHTFVNGIDIDSLYVDSIDSKPVEFDFDFANHIDFASEGTWQHWETRQGGPGDETECAECGEPIGWDESGWWHIDAPTLDLAEDPDEEGVYGEDAYDHEAEPDDDWKREGCEGPMMNYFYPIGLRYGLSHEDAAQILAETCLCLVEVHGETGLALTGGGMDLSWEICEAFMLLGSLPPAHFCRDLPKMATPYTPMHRLVIAGARRTLAIQRDWANDALLRVNDVEAWFENEAWERG